MPGELLDIQTADHSLLEDGAGFVVAFWTSLDWASKEPLRVIAGGVATGKWRAEQVAVEQRDRSPISSISRAGNLIFINLAYSLDDYAIPVLDNSLRLRGTIYGTVREVWPNGLVYYDVHQPHFGPHTIRTALFDPASGVDKEIYPPEPCEPVRCGYSERLKNAGGGPTPWIQAHGVTTAGFDWSRRALAFLARFKQEYALVTPPGWTEELTVMVVCDGLERIATSTCRETPLEAWRAAFPGVPDSGLAARAASNPTRVMAADNAGAQTKWRVPVTIEALRDVVVQRPDPRLKEQPKHRDRLDGPNQDPITIARGKRFAMVEILEEGGCTIEFEQRQYSLGSCWWLDGFVDHREDVFKVVTPR